VVAVTPIVAGAAVSGPTGVLMAAQGLPVSLAGVAQAYQDFLDVLIADTRDAQAAEDLKRSGVRVHCTPTIMRTSDDKAKLARAVLSVVYGENKAHDASDPS
jgi:LPPG:FO 2-phospho-L-lactate transferase